MNHVVGRLNGYRTMFLPALLLAGAAAAACTANTEGADIESESTGSVTQAINGVSCDQVSLEASRRYEKPRGFTDGHQSFTGGELNFSLPAEIPVTTGNAGRGKAILTLTTSAGEIECVYKGNLHWGQGDDEDDDAQPDSACTGDGKKYVLQRCKGRSNRQVEAGDPVQASSFNLHIQRGLRWFGTTTARLVIDETRPCDPVTRGEVSFHDRALVGLNTNGRACSDCHSPGSHFALAPAEVESRYQQMIATGIDDPLFRPIDADDFRTNGASASDYSNLRQNALIRISLPLPANVRLIDPVTNLPSSETFVDLWRGVPTVENVKLSGPDNQTPVWVRGPNPTGGYQHDGRIDTLQNQALDALLTHAGAQVAPTQGFLDDLAAYENTEFSSPYVQAIANGTSMAPDGLPPTDSLSPLEQQGKAVFIRSCGQCHGGPGLSTPITSPAPFAGTTGAIPRYHNVNAGCPRPVDTVSPARYVFPACPPSIARNARTYEFTETNGTKVRRTITDPGRSILSGVDSGNAFNSDFPRYDIKSLHGVSKTAPYFHNNAAANLEEVLDNYAGFFNFVKTVNPISNLLATTTPGVWDRPFTPDERPALIAFLNKL